MSNTLPVDNFIMKNPYIRGVFACFFCARTIFIRLLRSSGDSFFQNFFLPCTIRWTCFARSSGVASFHLEVARLRPSSDRFFFSDFETTTIDIILAHSCELSTSPMGTINFVPYNNIFFLIKRILLLVLYISRWSGWFHPIHRHRIYLFNI